MSLDVRLGRIFAVSCRNFPALNKDVIPDGHERALWHWIFRDHSLAQIESDDKGLYLINFDLGYYVAWCGPDGHHLSQRYRALSDAEALYAALCDTWFMS